MEVSLALIADYANVSREGKLNVMGVFDSITSQQFPAKHLLMQLVFSLEAPRVEAGKTHEVEIVLMGEDGQKLLGLNGKVVFDKSKSQPGDVLKINQILTLNQIVFPKAGNYTFEILINGERRRAVPLKLLQA